MPAGFRALLLDRVDVRTPGLHILKLALHRHRAERAAVAPHRHACCQALLYLQGEGRQVFSRHPIRVAAGTLVLIPRGVPHAFARAGGRAPLCLAVDFRFRPPEGGGPAVSTLTRAELADVRQSLARLGRMDAAAPGRMPCVQAASVLQLMITLLRSAGWLPRESAPGDRRPARGIAGLLAGLDPAEPLAGVIRRSGYQRDYLNHLVRRESGLTLGQFRAQRRLALAKRLLAERLRVGEVAAAVGLPDQNYFARWFRRQTGLPPSRWPA